jgi:hypothetical protein
MGVNIFQQIGGVNVVVSEPPEHPTLRMSIDLPCPRHTISLWCSRDRFILPHEWH